jgi:hypothetical protein
LLRSKVQADAAVEALQKVSLGQPSQGYLSLQLYNALDIAFDQSTDDRRLKSLLVITEGNDYPRGKTIKHVISRALQLQVTCNVAIVAEHTLYGSKSIQRYGFYLRRLAGKTDGRYIEVGGSQKNISCSSAVFPTECSANTAGKNPGPDSGAGPTSYGPEKP